MGNEFLRRRGHRPEARPRTVGREPAIVRRSTGEAQEPGGHPKNEKNTFSPVPGFAETRMVGYICGPRDNDGHGSTFRSSSVG